MKNSRKPGDMIRAFNSGKNTAPVIKKKSSIASGPMSPLAPMTSRFARSGAAAANGNPNSPANYAKSMAGAMKNTSTFGLMKKKSTKKKASAPKKEELGLAFKKRKSATKKKVLEYV